MIEPHHPVWDPSKLHFEIPMEHKAERSKELVLYIADACLEDPTYSMVKLYKILFYSDFESFARYGTPITGMPYRRWPFGPAPANFSQLQEEMIRDRQIRVVTRRVFDYASQRILPLENPALKLLSARDLDLVHRWIRFFWNMRAREVSKHSHGLAWKIAAPSTLIPYEAAFISNEPVTFEDEARAKELAEKYGWKKPL